MAKRKKSKARRKTKRGLGCGPGPVSGDCRFDRPLEGLRGLRGRGPIISLRGRGFGSSLRGGLRGTVDQHKARAERELQTAADHLAMANSADCEINLMHAVLAHDRSAQALAEAHWLPGSTQRITRNPAKREASAIWDRAHKINSEAASILRRIGRAGCKR